MFTARSKTILVLALLILGLQAVPVQARPYVSSQHYCLMEADSGQIIVSRQADEVRPVASTTKMLTAIVAVEYAELDERAVVSEKADHTAEYTIGLKQGQQLPIGELLKAALVKSSNDASVVLAEHVAGDEQFFAHLMNKKAFLLGAGHTHFENASGLPSQQHVSTAYDLALIGRYALSIPVIRDLVGSRQVEFRHPGYQKPLTLINTNALLHSYPDANGIKTGTTNAAGKCLVASAERRERQLIAVVLHAGDRSSDCARLLDYGFHQTQRVTVIRKGEPFKEIPVERGTKMIPVYPEKDLVLWVGEGTPDIEKQVHMNYQLYPPVKKGTCLGTLSLYADGKHVQSTSLVAGEDLITGERTVERWLKNFLHHLKESSS